MSFEDKKHPQRDIEDFCEIISRSSRRAFLQKILGASAISLLSPLERASAQMAPFAFWKRKKGVVPNLWSWGDGSYGQLGDGTTADKSSPVQIGTLTDWSKVSASMSHNLAIKADGTLWAWGNNFTGALGDGTTADRSSPVQIGALATWSKVSAGGA